jgi:hypothetical protein
MIISTIKIILDKEFGPYNTVMTEINFYPGVQIPLF